MFNVTTISHAQLTAAISLLKTGLTPLQISEILNVQLALLDQLLPE